MKRKITAALLACVMALTMLPLGVFAGGEGSGTLTAEDIYVKEGLVVSLDFSDKTAGDTVPASIDLGNGKSAVIGAGASLGDGCLILPASSSLTVEDVMPYPQSLLAAETLGFTYQAMLRVDSAPAALLGSHLIRAGFDSLTYYNRDGNYTLQQRVWHNVGDSYRASKAEDVTKNLETWKDSDESGCGDFSAGTAFPGSVDLTLSAVMHSGLKTRQQEDYLGYWYNGEIQTVGYRNAAAVFEHSGEYQYDDNTQVPGGADFFARLERGETFAESVRLDDLVIGGDTAMAVYSLRLYSVTLTPAQVAQNHFADVASRFDLDLSAYASLNGEERAMLHGAFRSVDVFGSTPAAVATLYSDTLTAIDNRYESLRGDAPGQNHFVDLVKTVKLADADVQVFLALSADSKAALYAAYADASASDVTAGQIAASIAAQKQEEENGSYYADLCAENAAFGALAKELGVALELWNGSHRWDGLKQASRQAIFDKYAAATSQTVTREQIEADIAAYAAADDDSQASHYISFLGVAVRAEGSTAGVRADFTLDTAAIRALESAGYTVTVGVLSGTGKSSFDAMNMEYRGAQKTELYRSGSTTPLTDKISCSYDVPSSNYGRTYYVRAYFCIGDGIETSEYTYVNAVGARFTNGYKATELYAAAASAGYAGYPLVDAVAGQ